MHKEMCYMYAMDYYSPMRKKDNPVLLDSANSLDEIILDKSVDAKSLLELIKILIKTYIKNRKIKLLIILLHLNL